MLGQCAEHPNTAIYFDGSDLERDCEGLMRFKLTYSGKLLSHKPLDKHAKDVRAWHKHAIRRHFHPQLKRFWEGNHFLKEARLNEGASHSQPPTMGGDYLIVTNPPLTMRDALQRRYKRNYGQFEYGWVPLAREEFALAVSLRILCLRRDGPGSVSISRDLDNRIKTLIDALTLPPDSQGEPQGRDGKALPPNACEVPYFYVLMADDKLVTHLEVETDAVLEPDPNDPADQDFVRMVVSVEIRPHSVNAFNLNYA